MHRRTVLAAIGVGLSGCSALQSQSDSTATPTAGPESTLTESTPTPTQTPTETETETPTPTDAPEPGVIFESCESVYINGPSYDEVFLYFETGFDHFGAGYESPQSFSGEDAHEGMVIHDVEVRYRGGETERTNPNLDSCTETPTPEPTETETPTEEPPEHPNRTGTPPDPSEDDVYIYRSHFSEDSDGVFSYADVRNESGAEAQVQYEVDLYDQQGDHIVVLSSDRVSMPDLDQHRFSVSYSADRYDEEIGSHDKRLDVRFD